MKILQNKSTVYLTLAAIIILGVFLRGYKALETFGFGHDADLFSWIVRDILIDHHIRLIGQETSTAGVFIGPLFYYFLTPFYLITGFHPASSIFAALTIGALIIFSYFFVFKKLFDSTTGLVAAFLQAVISNRIEFDRWIVPTVTVNLWCIWYFLAVVKIYRGNFNYLLLAGLMTGLIWHTHIALAPLLILIPLAVFFSRKWPNLKQIGFFIGAFIAPMLPYFLFEARHGFTQTASFFLSFLDSPENVYGGGKFDDVIRESIGSNLYLNLALLASFLLLPKLKVISYRLVILFYVWVISVIAFFTISKKLISEYYFENIRTVLLIAIILYVSLLIKSKNKFLKIFGFGIMAAVLLYSVNLVINLPSSGNGYIARSKVVEYIKNDAALKQYPCISVTHISSPGEDFGYRYLYWYNNIKMAKPGDLYPNYTIVFPYTLATESAKFRYGALNVIPPEIDYNLDNLKQDCPEEDYNTTSSFWGFTK